jgi:hypothetical protein
VGEKNRRPNGIFHDQNQEKREKHRTNDSHDEPRQNQFGHVSPLGLLPELLKFLQFAFRFEFEQRCPAKMS